MFGSIWQTISYQRCGAVALQLRRVSQPRDHRNRDPVAFGDGRQCLPVSAAPDGFLALVVRKLSRPSELGARSYSPLPAFSSALVDQVTLEVGDSGKEQSIDCLMSGAIELGADLTNL
jgi:hypothetical protein